LIKGQQWTPKEDAKVVKYVKIHRNKKWAFITKQLEGRLEKRCRDCWRHHLNPDINKGKWSNEEDNVLIQAHTELGNHWVEIAKRLSGRTDGQVRSRWNQTLKRIIMNNELPIPGGQTKRTRF